jgi:hypothetical protein
MFPLTIQDRRANEPGMRGRTLTSRACPLYRRDGSAVGSLLLADQSRKGQTLPAHFINSGKSATVPKNLAEDSENLAEDGCYCFLVA